VRSSEQEQKQCRSRSREREEQRNQRARWAPFQNLALERDGLLDKFRYKCNDHRPPRSTPRPPEAPPKPPTAAVLSYFVGRRALALAHHPHTASGPHHSADADAVING
jgi:hypothetical protein